jgi:hypothetical protein
LKGLRSGDHLECWKALYLHPEIRVVSQLSPCNNKSGNQLANPFPVEVEIEVAAEVASLAHRKPM